MAAEWTDERSAAGKRNPWLIVGVISLATFMEVLDTSIANVSLTHIAGGLSSTVDQATWVLTSYLVANAIIIPISGWLSDVIGRKRYYMISVALFSISSLCCGLAPSLGLLITARLFQGVGGGGLAPSEQSFLADTFPPRKRGQAFAAYGVVVVCGPVLGPTLGGWITDNLSWHWIFLINVPVGILSLLLVHSFVCEPPILERERRERLKHGLKVDYIGFALVALGLGCLEITLDRGERLDWFSSALITTTAIVAVVSIALLIVWELSRKDPIVDLRLMRNRNFALCFVFMTTTGIVLFGTTQLIPQMLQQVLGYSATDAGLALTTGGLATLVAMPIVGQLAGRVDTRLLIIPALLLQAVAMWRMSHFDSGISFGDASQARLLSAGGLPFLFIPINTAAYIGLRQDQTNEASSLLNVSRNLGGTLGIAAAQVLLQHRQQYHQARLVETLNPLNPNYTEGLKQIGKTLGGAAQGMDSQLAVLYQQMQTQAAMLGYVDVFHAFMVFVLVITPLALIVRQGKPAGGGH
jgi:DHA2 family multidrug resistance protein